MIKVVTDINSFEDIRNDWNRVFSQTSGVTPFQTFDYVKFSWISKCEQNCSLHLILYIRQKDMELQAVFPFYIDAKGTLRFINDMHTDFCDLIILDSAKFDYHLWDEVSKSIIAEKQIKTISLRNLRSSSPLISYFKYLLMPSIVYAENAYTTLSIDKIGPTENFISSLNLSNATDRNRIKKIQNKMKGVRTELYEAPICFPGNEVDFLLDKMINSGIREAKYFAELADLIKNLYTSGILKVAVTLKDEAVIAANVFLKLNDCDEYLSWLIFYLDKQYNVWSIIDNLQIISSKGGILNFCRGTYEYKIRNFRPQIHNLYTLRWSRSIWGQIGDLFAMNLYQVKQIVKKIIRK